jgi:ABC-type transporter Mla subunit MlaD
MRVEHVARMDETHAQEPTVEMSLESLSQALGKASEDLVSVRAALDTARADIAARNTSVSRQVVKDADRVIRSLRDTDEGLREVLKDLASRD